MRVFAALVLIQWGLSGCFNAPVLSKGKVLTLDEAPRLAETLSYSGTKSVAAYDPNSKVPTTIPAPSGALSGSTITLPAGALALSAELVVEEAVPLSQTSLTGSLNINSDIAITPIGSGLIIRPTEDVDLTQPLTIAMPINPTAGLRGWLTRSMGLNSTKFYTVFYKYFVNGELKAGAIRSDDLRFSDNGSVLFEGYFGAYWLAEVSAKIEEKIEVKTEEPIVNKDNVAVVTNTGVVTETQVLAKAAVPAVAWASVNLNFDASQRKVTITAKLASGPGVSSCQVDLFEKAEASSGINLLADASLKVEHVVTKKEGHSLVARFRCIDDESRLTMSPWSSAVTIPAVPVVTPVATPPVVVQPANNFCGNAPADLRLLFDGNPGTAASTTPGFVYQGSCLYTIDVDLAWSMGISIQTADGSVTCFTQSGVQVGEQTLDCAPSSSSQPKSWLPQGNFTLKLDFTGGATKPKLTASLQSCALGDLYLLTTLDTMNWPTPAASNRMTHLGGCQYSIQANKLGESSSYVRIQNQANTYICGDQSSLSVNSSKTVSCGASGNYYMQYSYGPYVAAYQYLLNLGSNLDISGQATSTPYLWVSEIDKCMENRYLLGPTAAGNNRQPGVNLFRKETACGFNYSWIQNGSSFTPFFIGVGEAAQKCGVAPATSPANYLNLDCSASAVAIDLQSLIANNAAYRLRVTSDTTTGQPNQIELISVNNVCSEPLYAVKNSTQGFFPNPQEALTEVSECIYQYDWLPTAASKSLAFINGHSPSTRCGKYPGFSNPSVGGPAVEFACYTNHLMNTDIAFAPNGVVAGNRYKVNLDLRLGYESPRISVSNHSTVSCPELYVPGLNGLNYPDASNRMTKIGDCSYAYTFKTPPYGINGYFRISDFSGSVQCGRDMMAAYANPTISGYTVPMSCSAGTPQDLLADIWGSSYFQLLVHYDSSGQSRISVNQMSQNCHASTFDGPSALDHNNAYSKNLMGVDSCVEEMLWVPTTTNNAFRLKMDHYGYSSYCGLNSGASQPTLSAGKIDALCNILNVTQVNHFAVAEGINPTEKYLVRLDRSGSPFAPPKLSVGPANLIYPNTLGTYLTGSTESSALNSTTYPGARSLSAVWAPPGSQYRYMFGGYGFSNAGGPSYLADLWRYDTIGEVWTLLPASNYGLVNGLAYTTGSFHGLNRPSGRFGAVAFYDPSDAGKLWMFGGEGNNSSGTPGLLNDLWVYDLGLNQWALMSGNPANINVNGYIGTPGVASHGHFPGSRREAHGWIDGSGKIYIHSGLGLTDVSSAHAGSIGRLSDLWMFDPSTSYATNTWTFLNGDNLLDQLGTANHPSSRQSAMAWKDAAGQFWLFGGYGLATNPIHGAMGNLNDLWSYNPGNNTWTRRGGQETIEATMTGGMRGVSSPHIWPAARHASVTWQSSDGKLWMFGGVGQTGFSGSSGHLNDVWTFNPAAGQWTWVSGLLQYINGAVYPSAGRHGEYGAPDSAGNFHPGSRSGAMAWPDASGNVWIFGGNGYGQTSMGLLNDLWYLDF